MVAVPLGGLDKFEDEASELVPDQRHSWPARPRKGRGSDATQLVVGIPYITSMQLPRITRCPGYSSAGSARADCRRVKPASASFWLRDFGFPSSLAANSSKAPITATSSMATIIESAV